MRSSNPAFKRFEGKYEHVDELNAMTVGGTVNKAFILFVIVIASALVIWNQYFTYGSEAVAAPMMIGVIGGLVAGFLTIFIPSIAFVTAPLYAIAEGMLLGGLSAMFEQSYQGITLTAVLLTFITFFTFLLIYKFEIIKVTDKLRSGIIAATFSVLLVYLLDIVLGFFGMSVPFLNDSGVFGIIISLVIVGIAAFNLLLDFDFIVKGSEAGLPKKAEWYGAFGLIVTLVWLYIEILDLIRKIRD